MFFRIKNFLQYKYQRMNAIPDFFGVFSNFSEVQDQNPWDKAPWISSNKHKLDRLQKEHFTERNSATIADQSHILLPAQILNLMQRNSRVSPKIRVLDVGGGTGFSYFAMYPYLESPLNFEWHVWDPNLSLYKIGADYLNRRSLDKAWQGSIMFDMVLPDINVEVIHLASTIEYVDEDEDLIELLVAKYQPLVIMLTRMKASRAVDFVTRQVINDLSVPCRFSNIDRWINCFAKRGYSCVMKAPSGGYEAGQFKDIPVELQISRGVDLVFAKNP